MSMTQDAKQIADWLIKRAASSPGVSDTYIATIRKAKGLLLTPGAAGGEAVNVAADMKTQGAALRAEESKKKAPAAPAPAAAASGANVKPKENTEGETGSDDGGDAAKDAVKAALSNPSAALALTKGALASQSGETTSTTPGSGKNTTAAPGSGKNTTAAPGSGQGATATTTAAETPDADDGANLGAGRRSRKTRHHTPKHKKLSRKKSVKRK